MHPNFYVRWRFTFLLTAMFVLLILRLATVHSPHSREVTDLFDAVVLAAALVSIVEDERFRRATLVLGLGAIVGVVAAGFMRHGAMGVPLTVIGRSMAVVFMIFTVVMILRVLLTQHKVTFDSLMGTFCGYLLIGAVWAEVYMLLEFVHPGALHFSAGDAPLPDAPAERWLLLEYFSFTTLTTLGYGDINPVSPMARLLACLEAILGQFYLTVLVAGLVGVRFSTRHPHDHPPTAAE